MIKLNKTPPRIGRGSNPDPDTPFFEDELSRTPPTFYFLL